jgi:serine/threonine-protein kinase
MSALPGSHLGRYQILERIGAGGMGQVYRAHDTALDRTVAIKVLSRGTHKQFDIDLLAREARASAVLSHPNIVSVLAFEVDDHGQPYLVREFVDGESLASVLRRRPLSQADALAVAASVCSALVAAHARGVIHRDLKPSNVLIPQGDQFGQAKLSDFGLLGTLGSHTGETRSGEIFGTPYYMSPEQLYGKPQSAATDLYGLGVLLYEMLFGFTPFRGDLSQLVVQVLNQPVAFPDVPPTPEPVRRLLTALLAKDPHERPRSAQAALSWLQALRGRAEDELAAEAVPRDQKVTPTLVVRSAPVSSAPSPPGRSRLSMPLVLGAVIGVSLGVVLTVLIIRGAGVAAGVLGGVAIGAGGVVLAGLLSKWLNAQRPAIADEASRVLLGAERRHLLTQSLAIDVDKLILQCRRIDQRVLGQTLALAVDQLQHAASSADQLAILPTVVSITTQLSERLTPWYVRYEKLVAFFVALVGLLTGIATAIKALP